MSKSLLLIVMLLCAAGVATAQTAHPRAEHGRQQREAQDDKDVQDSPQQRRAAVRAALEQRESKNTSSEERPSRARRQLTPQERQELRQQLRQQRNDTER